MRSVWNRFETDGFPVTVSGRAGEGNGVLVGHVRVGLLAIGRGGVAPVFNYRSVFNVYGTEFSRTIGLRTGAWEVDKQTERERNWYTCNLLATACGCTIYMQSHRLLPAANIVSVF